MYISWRSSLDDVKRKIQQFLPVAGIQMDSIMKQRFIVAYIKLPRKPLPRLKPFPYGVMNLPNSNRLLIS